MKIATILILGTFLASTTIGHPKKDIIPVDLAFHNATLAAAGIMDPVLLYVNCWAESSNNQLAHGPDGELGICQIMPGTWRALKCDGGVWNIYFSYQCAARALMEGMIKCGSEPWRVVWFYRSGYCPKSKTKHRNGHIQKIEKEMKRLRKYLRDKS